MDEDGWVPIHLVAGFKMVGKLGESRARFLFLFFNVYLVFISMMIITSFLLFVCLIYPKFSLLLNGILVLIFLFWVSLSLYTLFSKCDLLKRNAP